MKQYVIIKQFKINKQMAHYFDVLEKVYKFICILIKINYLCLSVQYENIKKSHIAYIAFVLPARLDALCIWYGYFLI